ncbi:MAG: type II secretion system GspH family protein, partial [Actinobacteria bacterium]|nr:type II secretion system GspH family protein [Actinomycetota bacterium]
MTLVEVVIAFLIIAIVSTVLVRGTITGVKTARINKSKTEALAIANEKIEILRAFDYSEIPIIDPGDSGYDQWIEDNEQLAEDVYEVNYYVTWVSGDETGYKQLRVTVEGGYMMIPLEVITQLYPPTGEEATIGNIYPPPDDLVIFSDEGEGALREIILNWDAPDTEKNILRYKIYRDGVFLENSSIEYYSDYPGDDNAYAYYVTADYEGEVESVKSNSVTTGTPWIYPPPEDLEIIGYSGVS